MKNKIVIIAASIVTIFIVYYCSIPSLKGKDVSVLHGDSSNVSGKIKLINDEWVMVIETIKKPTYHIIKEHWIPRKDIKRVSTFKRIDK